MDFPACGFVKKTPEKWVIQKKKKYRLTYKKLKKKMLRSFEMEASGLETQYNSFKIDISE